MNFFSGKSKVMVVFSKSSAYRLAFVEISNLNTFNWSCLLTYAPSRLLSFNTKCGHLSHKPICS